MISLIRPASQMATPFQRYQRRTAGATGTTMYVTTTVVMPTASQTGLHVVQDHTVQEARLRMSLTHLQVQPCAGLHRPRAVVLL